MKKSFIKQSLNATVIAHATKLTETWKKYNNFIAGEFGITVQQWYILLLIAGDPNILYLREHPQEKPLMAKELADALNVSRANITNLLNVLIDEDLVIQTEDKIDKRRKRLTLTPKATAILKKMETQRKKFNDALFAKITEGEKESFNQFAKKCIDIMTANGATLTSGEKMK